MNWKDNLNKIICVDNGSFDIRYSTGNKEEEINLLHNAKFIDKSFNQDIPVYLSNINDNISLFSSVCKNYQRPMSRGLLSDVDLEIEIWDNINHLKNKSFNAKESLFMFDYAPYCPDKVLEGYYQIIFEYYNFDSLFSAIPHFYTGVLSRQEFSNNKEYTTDENKSDNNSITNINTVTTNNNNINQSVQLIIDSGFSSTTIVPLLDGLPIYNSIKRIDVGGKLLTNYLKEALSNQTDLDMRKEFYLVNLMKHEQCFVSKNFTSDMKISSFKNSLNINKREFILPEYRNKSIEQLQKISKDRYSINLNALRFIIPEILFNPSLIGIEQGGIQEGIAQSIKECNIDYKNLLYDNIVLTGGNFNLPNIKQRLNHELIPNSDYDSEISIYDFKDSNNVQANTSVIKGMKLLCNNNRDTLINFSISKEEYDEIGFNIFWRNCI